MPLFLEHFFFQFYLKDPETELSSAGFFPQITAAARTGPGRTQEPRSQSRSPLWVIGTKVLELPFVAFHTVHFQETRIGSRAGT